MKINFFGFIVLSLFACIALACFPISAQSFKELFVSPTGNDANAGTLASPLATLEGAKNKIRQWKASGQIAANGITVYFREGTYPITETVAFNAEDAGTSQVPILYRNYENEAVSFSGGVEVPADALQKVTDADILQRLPPAAQNQVWMTDLKSLGITDYGQLKQHGFSQSIRPAPMELFVNGKTQTLARWPNEGKVKIGKVIDPGSNPRRNDFSNRGGSFMFDYDRAHRWQAADDIWLNGIFYNGFSDDNLKVESIDFEKRIIQLVQPHLYTIMSSDDSTKRGRHFRGYYVYNLLEEIDQPGEYFIDRDKGILYTWLPSSPASSKIVLSMMEEPMLALEGVSFVEFSGFTIENARGMGIYMENSEHVQISNCTLRNLGTLAIMMGKGAENTNGPVHSMIGKSVSRQIGNFSAQNYSNNVWNREAGTNQRIVNCKIYQTGTGGIILDGGDRRTLESGNNEVVNSEFYDLNRWNKTYCPAIWLRGVGNRVTHNYIHDLPHAGILLSGNDLTVEFNEIARVCQEFDDMGAIYTGRNPSERGNVIKHNYFHHIVSAKNRVAAIYFDDGISGGKVIGNVFYKTGHEFGTIHISAGFDHLIENNIFIDCKKAFYNRPWPNKKWNTMVQGKLWRKRMLQEVSVMQPPYSTHYPELKGFFVDQERKSRVMHNVLYQSGFVKSPKMEMVDNLITDQNPGFISIENENFSLKNEARIFNEIPDFHSIPFEKMGLQNNLE